MLDKIMNKDEITSIELLEQINFFREQESSSKTNHKDLMIIIETEFTDINRKRVKGGVCPETHTLIKEQLLLENIKVREYIHPQNNQKYPMYILPLSKAKQCLLKESKFVRKAMIHYIEELEKQLQNQFKVPTTFKEALQLALEQQEKIEALELQQKEDKPKVEYHDRVLNSEKLVTVTQIAKDLGMTAKALNQFLKDKGVQYKQSKTWLLTKEYQYFIDDGLCDYHITEFGQTLKWTELGRKWIIEKLRTE